MRKVTFFKHTLNGWSVIFNTTQEVLESALMEFEKTDQSAWVVLNQIPLNHAVNDVAVSFGKQLTIWGELTEAQFFEYSLRFYTNKEWDYVDR